MAARISNAGLPRLFIWKNWEQRQGRSRCSWERGGRPSGSATTTSSDPKSGCRRPCFDRTLSLARPPLRPKRSAYGLAGLRSGRASESVKPGGGPNESIEVGQIELTNTSLSQRNIAGVILRVVTCSTLLVL